MARTPHAPPLNQRLESQAVMQDIALRQELEKVKQTPNIVPSITATQLRENMFEKPLTEVESPNENIAPMPQPVFSEDFDWTSFMLQRASLPAICSRIAPHVTHLNRSLAEVICRPDSPILIYGGTEEQMMPALMKMVSTKCAYVQFLNDKSWEEVNLDQLMIPVSPYQTSPFATDNVTANAKCCAEQMVVKIQSFIKVGHHFELIDAENPKMVRVVRILSNTNGFLDVVDAQNNHFKVFIGSERCKRLGWTSLKPNDGEFRLQVFLGATVKTTVPWYVFAGTSLKEHNVENGYVCEVIDPVTRFRIIPGIVTEIVNKYYFRVALLQSLTEPLTDAPSIVCHRSSPDLLPANFAQKNSLRLTVPKGYEENGFSIYKIRGRPLTENSVDLPKNNERFDSLRHIEVYDEVKNAMVPATILRQIRHLLVIRFECERDFSSPRLYSFADERLFKVGTAEKFGLRLLTMPVALEMKKWKVDSTMKMTSRPDQHNPAKGVRYMCKAFAEDEFLPDLYVNLSCYKGPFVNVDKARFLDQKFVSSPMLPMLHHIVHALLETLNRDFQKICGAAPDSVAPKCSIKLFNANSERTRTVNVESCEKASEFPGWMRQFLLRLDMCPNFISPTKREAGAPCPYNCHLIERRQPWMVLSSHLNIPIPVSKQEEHRARRENSTAVGGVKKPRTDSLGAQKSDFPDLDEALAIRRARRTIKRQEFVDTIDEDDFNSSQSPYRGKNARKGSEEPEDELCSPPKLLRHGINPMRDSQMPSLDKQTLDDDMTPPRLQPNDIDTTSSSGDDDDRNLVRSVAMRVTRTLRPNINLNTKAVRLRGARVLYPDQPPKLSAAGNSPPPQLPAETNTPYPTATVAIQGPLVPLRSYHIVPQDALAQYRELGLIHLPPAPNPK